MITAYIFTRNRAAQLDLLLRSLAANLPGLFKPYVVWRADSPEYAEGYREAVRRHPAADWVEDAGDPRSDMRAGAVHAEARSGLLCLFTDDCVAWRPATISPGDVAFVMSDPFVLTASLRLGLNTLVQDYTTGRRQPPLGAANPSRFEAGETWLKWDYRSFSPFDNYGYPFAMDAAVYRAADVLDWLDRVVPGMRTYREWEGALHLPHRRAEAAGRKTLMASPARSCVVNVPCNSSQVDPTASGTAFPVSKEGLNADFLAGRRIALGSIPFGEVDSCHREYPLVMEAEVG